MRLKIDRFHLNIRDSDSGPILFFDQLRVYTQSCLRPSCADVLEHGFITVERPSAPVFADLAEETMFDRILRLKFGRQPPCQCPHSRP
jgi:hypothetical protein